MPFGARNWPEVKLRFPPNVEVEDTFNVPVIPVLVKEDTPTTFKEFNDAAEVVVKDPPMPTLPVILAFPQTSSLLLLVVAPIPRLPEELMKVVLVPELTWKVWEGEEVPIPNLLFVLSQ